MIKRLDFVQNSATIRERSLAAPISFFVPLEAVRKSTIRSACRSPLHRKATEENPASGGEVGIFRAPCLTVGVGQGALVVVGGCVGVRGRWVSISWG